MKEDYVSFEIAKLLKEKGFDCPTQYHYCVPDDKYLHECLTRKRLKNSELEKGYSTPTLQMAMKWLREKYNIHIEVEIYYCEDGQLWLSKIQKIDVANTILLKTIMCKSLYEEAVESAIKYCLTNLI